MKMLCIVSAGLSSGSFLVAAFHAPEYNFLLGVAAIWPAMWLFAMMRLVK